MRFTTSEGPLDFTPSALTIAGWTGRDRAAVDHHIAELAELGVPGPSDVPLFYRCSAALLTQADEIEALGEDSSGEVEPILLRHEGALWLGVGSDHTDRGLEAHSVAASKQICAKPVGRELWRFDELSARLDELTLLCQVEEEGQWRIYQHGALAKILPLTRLLEKAPLAEGGVMLCGTLPAIGGVRPARRYRMEIRDPAGRRAIPLDYSVRTLEVIA